MDDAAKAAVEKRLSHEERLHALQRALDYFMGEEWRDADGKPHYGPETVHRVCEEVEREDGTLRDGRVLEKHYLPPPQPMTARERYLAGLPSKAERDAPPAPMHKLGVSVQGAGEIPLAEQRRLWQKREEARKRELAKLLATELLRDRINDPAYWRRLEALRKHNR